MNLERVIYKYTLPAVPGTHTLTMPRGTILDVQAQRGQLVLWLLTQPVDRPSPHTETFVLVETGAAFDYEGYAYLKTAQLRQGAYVLHVFHRRR